MATPPAGVLLSVVVVAAVPTGAARDTNHSHRDRWRLRRTPAPGWSSAEPRPNKPTPPDQPPASPRCGGPEGARRVVVRRKLRPALRTARAKSSNLCRGSCHGPRTPALLQALAQAARAPRQVGHTMGMQFLGTAKAAAAELLLLPTGVERTSGKEGGVLVGGATARA